MNKDVAAFLLDDTSRVHAFDLAKSDAKKGDTVYLLANLTNSETVNPDGIYPAVVTSVDDGGFQYKLDAKYGTGGAAVRPLSTAMARLSESTSAATLPPGRPTRPTASVRR